MIVLLLCLCCYKLPEKQSQDASEKYRDLTTLSKYATAGFKLTLRNKG